MRKLFIQSALTLACASGALAQGVGTSFCSPTSNSTGAAALLTGTGGSGVGSNLHLDVAQGVPGELGYFLAGNEATPGIALGQGMLCLVGTGTSVLYRYNVSGSRSNSIGQFDSSGVLQNLMGTSTVGTGFDVPSAIPGTIPITIMSGDTWHFQFWYRDSPVAQSTSNFSNGLSVTFPVTVSPVPIAGMVPIQAGSFEMGSNAASTAPYFNDANMQPVHQVTLSESFWMSSREVTQSQYEALMGTNPSYFVGPNNPVEKVTWDNARAYCAALTAQERAAGNVPSGMEYRLPTEAEWEYACRGGTTTEFGFGADLACGQATVAFSHHGNSSCNSNGPTAVGSHQANAFGIYDMHGNVWEWTLDSFGSYSSTSQTDPFVTGGTLRSVRGGCWFGDTSVCRSAYRGGRLPDSQGGSIGIRVVLASVLVP